MRLTHHIYKLRNSLFPFCLCLEFYFLVTVLGSQHPKLGFIITSSHMRHYTLVSPSPPPLLLFLLLPSRVPLSDVLSYHLITLSIKIFSSFLTALSSVMTYKHMCVNWAFIWNHFSSFRLFFFRMRACTMAHMWRSKETWRSRFSPSTVEVLGIERGFIRLAGTCLSLPSPLTGIWFFNVSTQSYKCSSSNCLRVWFTGQVLA